MLTPIRSLACATVLFSAVAMSVASAFAAPSGPPIPLWPDGAPGAHGTALGDIPTLTPFVPEAGKANGASMLILPGGGYQHLADHEGSGYAEWFVQQGITCYVLKYRLGSDGYHHPAMLDDASRGLRLVRLYARRDGLDPARVGVIGSSAGGHLASTLVTHFADGNPAATDLAERESSRPDLAILCYPVISLGEYAHKGSRDNLLGPDPDPKLATYLSSELQVTKETPPCFIWSTDEDRTVPVENSLMFAAALRRAGVPFALHIYEHGGHGLGLGRPGHPAPPWADQCLYWLKGRGFLKE